ncbi:predicted protein [Nematostella vectensis]|uniref:peptidylprolyl isomerase n=1 Tax=Nematostella vectensis TaxID=45351 RepID=A7SRS8_NEMVE|nr:predicted protein [Nematostella vectensis]|eukprot:XP_001625667.1 predicted protein [Nematostella vectensis]
MAAEPTREYTDEQLNSDAVSKKDIIKFLHENASFEFLKENKLNGKLNNVAKTSKKDQLAAAYNKLFEEKAFKKEGEESLEDQLKAMSDKANALAITEKKNKKKTVEEPKYKKRILKEGDKVSYPDKGDMVSCLYVGKLEDGTVFDTNRSDTAKRNKKGDIKPLIFPVGRGKVIRGWDEALLTMSQGEKAELTIDSEWAYGRKGFPDAKIPPFSTLIFEVELVNVAK